MKFLRRAAAPLVVLALAACNPATEAKKDAGAPEPSSRNLAASLKADPQLGRLEDAVAGAGLESVLEGVGPYTVFAPTDQAFSASAIGDLDDPELRAQGAALIRAHIVPGALTRRDIAAALDRAGADTVEMRTMADDVLRFSRSGEAIVVTAPDGASATLTGSEILASNGVLQPMDGVLLKPAA